jgi:hypothetical protein
MNVELEERIQLERRITKVEENLSGLHGEITEIKKTLRWLMGLVFSLNTTIIGILTKGFGVL